MGFCEKVDITVDILGIKKNTYIYVRVYKKKIGS